MAAYAGDTSEETKAKVQQLKVELEEARTNLQETEYDKYISDQQKLLDELYLEYEEILNTRLDNVDALVSDMIEQININSSTINSTISEKIDAVGYTLSDSMSNIWNENSTSINSVITTYGDKFSAAQTTTNNTLNSLNINLQNIIAQLNSMADVNVKIANSSSAANSSQANASPIGGNGSGSSSGSGSGTSNGSGSGSGGSSGSSGLKPNNAVSLSSGGSSGGSGSYSQNSSATAGSTITVPSGIKIYGYAGSTSGVSQYFKNDPTYTVIGEKGDYIQVRWHKAGGGVTGWFKKSDIPSYATGKKNFLNNEIAWTQDGGREMIIRPSDGAILTPIAKGDSILNTIASGNIWDMANNPAEFIRDNLNLGNTNLPNNSSVNNTYTQYLDKVVFSLPNVKNYDEMLSALKDDPNFERLILSMSIDRLAGKSSLAKGKSIR